MAEEYDFAIIGAGGSGLAAAMYAARLGMKTIVFGKSTGTEMPIGGVITTTNVVENYPGFIRLTGTELAEKIKEHALSYPLVTLKQEEVLKVVKVKDKFELNTKKQAFSAKAVLFATGTRWRKLEVPGGKEFENKGIAYCALCDAPLFKNKIVAVVGGSDSAGKDALVLSEHAKKVYIIYRGEKIRAEQINIERIKAKENIEIITNTNVVAVQGKEFVERVVLDKEYKGEKELELQGVFVAIGHVPISELAVSIGVKANDKGELVIDHKTCETNVKGVYAAGDVADKPFKQLITGVAEGCTAAYSASEFIGKGE